MGWWNATIEGGSMPQSIAKGTGAKAWVEKIIISYSSGPQVKRAKKMEEFAERPRSLFEPGEPLDMATRGRMEAFFGRSLEEVRIHREHEAEAASHKLGARAFTSRGHIFAPRQNLDTSSAEGLGLLAHELTHVIQQTQPHRLPQGERAKHDYASPAAATPPGSHSDVEMVLLAPAIPPTSPQLREAQARDNEQLVREGLTDNETKSSPEVNLKAVANRVYHLMQSDLVLERERATKLGG